MGAIRYALAYHFLNFLRGKPMKYEVQHWTLCNSWINTWTVTDSEGNESPSYFPSYAQAQAALSDFLKEELIEYQNGNIESPYTSEEFRITPVTH